MKVAPRRGRGRPLLRHRGWGVIQDRSAALAKASRLQFPVYVKPARGGSSLGISRVATPRVWAAIEEARRHDPKVLVEEGFSDVREVEWRAGRT